MKLHFSSLIVATIMLLIGAATPVQQFSMTSNKDQGHSYNFFGLLRNVFVLLYGERHTIRPGTKHIQT